MSQKIKKLSTAMKCADATNYYDIVAYHYASLCAKCFAMDLNYLLFLFRTAQLNPKVFQVPSMKQ